MKYTRWYISRNKKQYTSWHTTIWYISGSAVIIADHLCQFILILILHLIALALADEEAYEQYGFTYKQLKQLIKTCNISQTK